MARRIAVCALIPDTGHVTPLLLLARHLAARGDHVCAFLPDEGQRVSERFGVRVETFGTVNAPNQARLIDRAASVSRWAHQVYWARWFTDEYMAPVKVRATRLVPELVSRLRQYDPELLITDDHIFEPEYRWLAGQLGIPLLLNHCFGTNCAAQPRKFWLNVDVKRATRIGDWVRSVEYTFDKRLRPERWHRIRDDRRQVEQFRAARASDPAPPRVERLSMGLSALEIERLGDRIVSAGGVHRLMAPTPQLVGTMEPALAEWLGAAEPRSVLYVASGTMARMPVGVLRSITRDALRAGLRVLVADGGGRFAWRGDPRRVLVQRWVPQTAVLAHPSIATFVTHAGANSVQEALWNGLPILCRPLLWDQHYNAWVAEELGFGLCLDVSGMPRERFALRLRRVLDTPSYRECARQIGASFSAEPGEVHATRLIDSMLTAAPARIPEVCDVHR